MARLRRILKEGETVVLRVPTARERLLHVVLWGVGLPFLALQTPYLFGFYDPNGGGFWLAAKLLAGVGPVIMILQYWRHRLRIAVTDRRILVRRGNFWGRHEAMDLRDISSFDYDLKSRTLLLYGNRRVLEIRCDLNTRARIVVSAADAV